MSTNHEPSAPPDGIGDEHSRPVASWQRHASPLALVVFGVVIVLALAGVFGRERDWRAEANATRLNVHGPESIRNGEFFEMRVGVEADRAISELVIGVDQGLWEDMTVNTIIPTASEEEAIDGEFRFVFAELEPQTPFLLKLDLQVNPDIVGGNEGVITVYDGERVLAETPISIGVLP
ncbi:MAG: hypothetical protein M3153_01265 [Chloroflexota bacterium]|nr:hypothetical protein [Chloroflexota bacterium]